MKRMAIIRRSTAIISGIVVSVFLLVTCIAKQGKDKALIKNHDGELFAGSVTCAGCHKNIYDTHISTAHFHTSEIASEKNIKGSFDPGKNIFRFSTGGVVEMSKREGGFYQVAYINGVEKKSQRFDIVFGSGTKGQSYLTWADTNLFQLPITYFTAVEQWSNSPGYPDKIAFDRPITSRCLECHVTYADKLSEPFKEPVAIDKNRIIMGVDCERCHGPAAKHVAFQSQNPNEKAAKFIINPASFSRQQSLDMCALCHEGGLKKTKPSFEFTAGDKLSDYFVNDTVSKDASNIDVHGNQYGLLAASKCFRLSKTLTCITCHNTHENEKGKTALFSQRCTGCHNNTHADAVLCKMTKAIGPKINENCTNCHMPQMASRAVAVLLQDDVIPTPALMHTHLIKVYPDQTKKILAFLKKK